MATDAADDRRYSLRLEWTGSLTSPRSDGRVWVVRFLGDWVGSAHHIEEAADLRHAHFARRKVALLAA